MRHCGLHQRAMCSLVLLDKAEKAGRMSLDLFLHHPRLLQATALPTEMKLSASLTPLSLGLIATLAAFTQARPHEEIELLVPRWGCNSDDMKVEVGPVEPKSCKMNVCVDSADALLKNITWKGCGPATCTEEGPKGGNSLLEKRTGGSFTSPTGYRGEHNS